jgi:hypothetical protein
MSDSPPEKKPSNAPFIAVMAIAGVLVVVGAIVAVLALLVSHDEDKQARQAAVAEDLLDDALSRPPDTAARSNGTQRYDAPAPAGSGHAYHLTLPRGWNARYVGAKSSDKQFFDSVLTKPDPKDPAFVSLARLTVDEDISSERFGADLRDGLDGADSHITSPYTPTTIGGQPAYYLDGTTASNDRTFRTRTVVYARDGETFLVQFAALKSRWTANLAALNRLLASFRVG